MAEEEGDLESERFKEQLGSLLNCRSTDECGSQSKDYCARFCELVEDQTGQWQVPLPQLQVLRTALCYFARDTVTFPSDCEHVLYALSSLALSFFELLLFFGKDEFLESPLKDILESFQECHSCLVRHKNVYLLLLKQVIKDGGPWENTVLQAILRETAPPREEVERYLSSEVPLFFELRVRYLLACDRVQEAVALAKSCIEHSEAGRCLYFHQAYLTCLLKASLYDHLQKEIAEIDGKDAVEIICNSENEERDDLLLALSRAFLMQQLHNGDMYYIWDLIFIWSKIHLRANPSKRDFLEECHQLMLSATNVKSIFPFIKVIRAELGTEGLQFCVELCGRALQTDLHNDPVTKLLIYKTLVFLLPNDLEVCRACALLVFFLERTVESYKTVYLLYTQPDQEYHADYSLVKNHIRFEVLQILKKGLFFDPEFWNLITLRTNCLKLMSEKVMQAALNEIMEEDKWIPNYCVKEPSKIILDTPVYRRNQVRRHPVKKLNKPVIRRIVVPPEVVEVSLVKKRGRKPGSRVIRVTDDSQLRRSFRQLDMVQENSTRQHDNRQERLLARQVEKKTLKRRGRKPRWLLQEVAKQAENRLGQPDRKNQLPTNEEAEKKLHDHSLEQAANDTEKTQEVFMEETGCHIELIPVAETENEETVLLQEEGLPLLAVTLLDDPVLTPVPLTMVEITIPDNEVMDASAQEVEMQSLADIAIQEPRLEDTVDMEVGSVEHPFTESDREEDSADERPADSSWFALPPEARGEGLPTESAVEEGNDVIQLLHNYSRHPEEEHVEENIRSPAAGPEELHIAPQESPSESTEPGQDLSGKVSELSPVEVGHPSQTPAGAASSSKVDIEVPESMPEAVDEVPEAVCHQELIQAEESRVSAESSDNLQDHEWRHYPVPDAKDDSFQMMQMRSKVGRPARGKRKDSRDDSGHRLKVQKKFAKPEAAVLDSSSPGGKAVTDSIEVKDENKAVIETSTVERPVGTEDMKPPEGSGSDAQILNGHRENATVLHIQMDTISTQDSGKETTAEINNVDKKTEAESIESHQEPVVQAQKMVKEVEVERTGYGGSQIRPFVRPPPSAYLDECFISMPKRRKSSPAETRSSVEQCSSSCEAQRQRCSKCFSSFNTAEALQSHLSLNKCTSLFGFDSDEESAW
ncbi:hypothetical protein SKAU_G00254850 [Synaphobranchus kaupii]|uniref:Zinc finger protein Rlf/292/654 TPR repeats domain-containing protein n=1 Tax=Synaphobranchus kaupii TaxID=118154 RepID=A0A9Q1F3J9_SYNKA|nr:hypothetical protein SKAU_G00254850 [Synaphobranchus kaupii]